MQNRRDSKSRLNSAAQHMLSSNVSMREADSTKRTDFQGRIEDLQEELRQKDLTLAALQRNYEGISRFYKEEKGKSKEWVDKVANLEKENSILRSKVQTFESQKQKALQDLDKTQEEVQKLIRGYEEVRGLKTENVTIKVLFEKKKKECDEYSSKLETARTEVDALKKVKIDLESVIKKLKIDSEMHGKEKQKIMKEHEETKTKCCTLEKELGIAMDEISRLSRENFEKNMNETSSEQLLSQLKSQLGNERSEISTLRARVIELSSMLETMKSQLELKDSKLLNTEASGNSAIRDLQSKLADSQAEIAQLTERLRDLGIIDTKFSELSEESKILHKQLEFKSIELEQWKKEAKSLADNLNQILKQSEIKKKQFEDEIRLNNVKQKEAYEEKEHYQVLLSKIEGEFKNYLESKDRSLTDCKQRIDDYNKSLEYSNSTIKKLREDLENTTQLYTLTKHSLQQSLDENIKISKKNATIMEELENLKRKLKEEEGFSKQNGEKTKQEAVRLQDKISTLSREILELKESYANIIAQYEKAQGEISNLSKIISENMKIEEDLKSKLKQQSDQIEIITKEKNELSSALLKLEGEEIKNREKVNSCERKLSLSLNENSKLNSELREQKDIQTKLSIQLSSKDLEISKLENSLLVEKNNYRNVCDDNANLVKRLQDFRDEKDKIKNLEEETHKRIKTLNEREKQISQVLERFENGLNSLESSLTCLSCFNPLENAIVSIPCGHLHCGSCKPKDLCKECDSTVKQMISISIFDGLGGKIQYEKQALRDMKHLLKS